MEKTDLLSIRVNIAERFYPLRVERADEEKIRKAAKLINDKIIQYQKRYVDKEAQDFLAMAALQYVTKVIEYEEKYDEAPIIGSIERINSELNDYIAGLQEGSLK
jgi:cell division protein ZapA